MQILCVLTVRTSFRSDHLKVFDTAIALLGHSTIAETHYCSYFMKYPNNIPICLLTHGFLKIASIINIPEVFWMEYMKLVNITFMNIGLWCTYDLVRKYRSRQTGIILLLFLMINPLWYLLGHMYYTSTISLAFSMGAIWLFDKAENQKHLGKGCVMYLLTGMLLGVGFKIRATMIITIIALIIFSVLQGKKGNILKVMTGLLSLLAGVVLIFATYGKQETLYAGFDSSKTGYPAVHWIAMSAQGDGQYNSYDDGLTGALDTKEQRAQAAWKRLKDRICEMGPVGLVNLLKNKMRVTFSDGTDDCQTLFSTMQKTSGVQKYIYGGRGDYLAVYLHGYHSLLMILFLVGIICRIWRKEGDFLDVFAFNICGAYLFYLIWESNHAYSIPFMFMFLIWSADGIRVCFEKYQTICRQKKVFHLVPVIAEIGLVIVFIGIGLYMRCAHIPVREYSVLQDQETTKDFILQTEFAQTFQTDKAFDHVDIWVANWVGEVNDSIYELEILDKQENVVAKGEIVSSKAPCISSYTVFFERVVPETKETYRLQIRLKNPQCDFKTDFLYYQTDAWDMYAEGDLYLSDVVEKVDLAFAVYEEKGS